MSREDCPVESPDCKYYPDCFSDAHHLYGRPKTQIAKRFARLPDNVVQLCRIEHEETHATEGVLELPDVEVMKQAIAEERKNR